MAERETARIARDLMSEPHIRGRRISVRQVSALVEDGDEDPEAVADRFDLDVADVFSDVVRDAARVSVTLTVPASETIRTLRTAGRS